MSVVQVGKSFELKLPFDAPPLHEVDLPGGAKARVYKAMLYLRSNDTRVDGWRVIITPDPEYGNDGRGFEHEWEVNNYLRAMAESLLAKQKT